MENSHGACDDCLSEGRAGRGATPGEEGDQLGGGARRRGRSGHGRAALVRRQGLMGYGRGGGERWIGEENTSRLRGLDPPVEFKTRFFFYSAQFKRPPPFNQHKPSLSDDPPSFSKSPSHAKQIQPPILTRSPIQPVSHLFFNKKKKSAHMYLIGFKQICQKDS